MLTVPICQKENVNISASLAKEREKGNALGAKTKHLILTYLFQTVINQLYRNLFYEFV